MHGLWIDKHMHELSKNFNFSWYLIISLRAWHL
jgi:hypothetical protein